MSEFVQFSSIFPLISTYYVTLTMIDLKTIFVVSIIHQTDHRTWNHQNRPTGSWYIIFYLI